MKKIKRAYILLFVCVMTVCFSGCQNQSNVSSEDVENSLFMEWCSRFRASNEPLILITFPDGTSTSLVGENAVTAASDMEKALAALTADDFYHGVPWRLPKKLLFGKECYIVTTTTEQNIYRERPLYR